MGTSLPESSFSNVAIVKMLMECGAKTHFRLTLPNHRLPSWNQILSGTRKQQFAAKKEQKEKVDTSLVMWRANDTDSWSFPTEKHESGDLIDNSNPYFKAIEDRLTHHAIIPDDSPKYCDQPLYIQTTVMPGEERTEIIVLTY